MFQVRWESHDSTQFRIADIRHVTNFKDFLGRSPDTATSEDLRFFQLHMTRNHVGAPSINCAIVALRFFFKVTLERPDLVRHLTFVHEPRKLPIVLSPEEVARLLEAMLPLVEAPRLSLDAVHTLCDLVRPQRIPWSPSSGTNRTEVGDD